MIGIGEEIGKETYHKTLIMCEELISELSEGMNTKSSQYETSY